MLWVTTSALNQSVQVANSRTGLHRNLSSALEPQNSLLSPRKLFAGARLEPDESAPYSLTLLI